MKDFESEVFKMYESQLTDFLLYLWRTKQIPNLETLKAWCKEQNQRVTKS